MRWVPAWLLLGGCAMTSDVSPEIEALYDRYLEERAALDPEWATGIGMHAGDGELTRWDDEAHAARAALVDRWLDRIPGESLDARLWRSDLRSQQHEFRRRDVRTVSPGLPLGTVSVLHDMLVKDYAPKAERIRSINRRLAGWPAVLAGFKSRLGRPPKVWTRMAIDDAKGALDFFGELGEADPVLVAAAKAALEDYVAWMERELLPRSDGSFAIGKASYEFHLRNDQFLEMGAEELEAVGEREFAKTLGMLEALAPDWVEELERMKKDHPTPAGLLERYRREVAKARRFMSEKDLVGIPGWEQLEVVETPAFLQSTMPYAAYSRPGPLDGARTGHFYVTPVAKGATAEEAERQLAAHNEYDIPGTVWHEAYPGHHLQFVYAKDLRSKIRKLNDSPLLSEGWGLYCEELAFETGYYTDRRERLMQLNWRLQRAARILLDVRLHLGRIGWEEAVAFLVDKVRLNRPQAESSVNAYTQAPTYYPAYLLGMLEIVRIREARRAAEGAGFSLRAFHERFLSFGNVPPALIEAHWGE